MSDLVDKQIPTLAVVMPNYNHARLLPRALDALLKQSFKASEIIVLDDCSTDNSRDVLKDYASRFPEMKVIENVENLGAVGNMNKGLSLVNSDYVCYAAADDFVHPGFFEKVISGLAKNRGLGLGFSVGEWIDEATGVVSHVGAGLSGEDESLGCEALIEAEIGGRLMIPSNACIFRVDALREVGGFDPQLKWHCDWFSMYTLAFRYGICFVPEPLAVFFMHAAGYSARTDEKVKEHEGVMKAIVDKLETPEFSDVRPAIQESGALFVFGKPMMNYLKSDSSLKGYLTAVFLKKCRWYAFKMAVKPLLPKWLAELYLKISGGRVTKKT